MNIVRILFSNFGYKVLAVFLATLFWYIIQSEQSVQIKRTIRIRLTAPEGLVVREGSVLYREAYIQGPRALISGYPMKPLEAKIKLYAPSPQQIRMKMNRDYLVTWDERLRLIVHDPYFSVYLDKKAEKDLVVKENLIGLPQDGSFVEDVILEPATITATGPATDLALLDALISEPVDISQISGTKTVQVAVAAKSPAILLSHKRISITIVTAVRKVKKTFEKIEVATISDSDLKLQVVPPHVTLIIQGAPELIAKLEREQLKVSLDTIPKAPGSYPAKLHIEIPPEVVLVEVMPSKVIIKATRKGHSIFRR